MGAKKKKKANKVHATAIEPGDRDRGKGDDMEKKGNVPGRVFGYEMVNLRHFWVFVYFVIFIFLWWCIFNMGVLFL